MSTSIEPTAQLPLMTKVQRPLKSHLSPLCQGSCTLTTGADTPVFEEEQPRLDDEVEGVGTVVVEVGFGVVVVAVVVVAVVVGVVVVEVEVVAEVVVEVVGVVVVCVVEPEDGRLL